MKKTAQSIKKDSKSAGKLNTRWPSVEDDIDEEKYNVGRNLDCKSQKHTHFEEICSAFEEGLDRYSKLFYELNEKINLVLPNYDKDYCEIDSMEKNGTGIVYSLKTKITRLNDLNNNMSDLVQHLNEIV